MQSVPRVFKRRRFSIHISDKENGVFIVNQGDGIEAIRANNNPNGQMFSAVETRGGGGQRAGRRLPQMPRFENKTWHSPGYLKELEDKKKAEEDEEKNKNKKKLEGQSAGGEQGKGKPPKTLGQLKNTPLEPCTIFANI